MYSALSVEELRVEAVAAAVAGTTGSGKSIVVVVATVERIVVVGIARTAAVPAVAEVDHNCN